MEIFLPSVFLMLVVCIFTMLFVPKLSPFVIAIIATVFIGLTAYNHYALFSNEYRIMTWADSIKHFAPTILTLLVIVLTGIYLMYIFTTGKGVANLPMPPGSIPPPETATNVVTEAIGNGLVAAGAPVNNAYRNAAESMVSKIA